MAKIKPGKKDFDSYTIKGTTKVVRDCVLMRPSDSDKLPYMAQAPVEKLEVDHRNNVKVRVPWYYRPEDSLGGRGQFHGAKELFLSDHYDVQSAHTEASLLTVLLCTASVRCLVLLTISWCSVKGAKTGFILLVLVIWYAY